MLKEIGIPDRGLTKHCSSLVWLITQFYLWILKSTSKGSSNNCETLGRALSCSKIETPKWALLTCGGSECASQHKSFARPQTQSFESSETPNSESASPIL